MEVDIGATSGATALFLRLRRNSQKPNAASTASTTTGTTTPIAALAPVESPDDGFEVGVACCDVPAEVDAATLVEEPDVEVADAIEEVVFAAAVPPVSVACQFIWTMGA